MNAGIVSGVCTPIILTNVVEIEFTWHRTNASSIFTEWHVHHHNQY